MTYHLAQKPANGGMPVNDSMNSIINAASSGARRPSPVNVEICDVTPGRRCSAATTANAPRFMNEYATL